MFNFDLSQDIERFLLTTPSCKEYDIICHLQSNGRLHKKVLSTPLSLFRCHFLIFNALYRLQYLSHSHQNYQLSISSLYIQLSPYDKVARQTGKTLNKHDALGLFYLDLCQLNQTKAQDVQHLLDIFWQQYFNPKQIQQALNILALNQDAQNIDFKTIKKQYRRLVMKHHPDRGGDANQLIAIHQAMQCLELYY